MITPLEWILSGIITAVYFSALGYKARKDWKEIQEDRKKR